jgi:hypothetical protein
MRRPSVILIATILALAIASPASAAKPAGRGFTPPNATVHGQTLTQLAAAWTIWGFGSAADVNPLLDNRCEQSPTDPKIWFMPVSLGGDYAVSCQVPQGAWLFLTVGGYECSDAEGNGTTEAELRACAEAGFATFNAVEAALDGRPASRLDRYIVTTPVFELPAANLFQDAPSASLIKGWFLLVHPLSKGQHTLRAFADAASVGFSAGITINITVGAPAH